MLSSKCTLITNSHPYPSTTSSSTATKNRMSQKAITEYAGKQLLARWLAHYSADAFAVDGSKVLRIGPTTDLDSVSVDAPWVLNTLLVVKPDQLIKRRGKSGLILLRASWEEAVKWIQERRNKPISIGPVTAELTHFLIEPFVSHGQDTEHYICIRSVRGGNLLLYCRQGGVDVGDVDTKSQKMQINIQHSPTADEMASAILGECEDIQVKSQLALFLQSLYKFYVELNFAYLEINPLVVTGTTVHILDLAAKLDSAASFECAAKWGDTDFPAPFGHIALPEEEFIQHLDEKTGASLKLTILNMKGRVWLMVAGGGASVIFADTLSDLGYGREMANYGEYSGAPTEQQTFDYARTIIGLMCREPNPVCEIIILYSVVLYCIVLYCIVWVPLLDLTASYTLWYFSPCCEIIISMLKCMKYIDI